MKKELRNDTKGRHRALRSSVVADERIVPKASEGECIILYDDDTYDVASYASYQELRTKTE